ncbi:MAG: radical SAM/SPASM domain-containing protein [Candidatus Aenigmatarchaeota archaeon]
MKYASLVQNALGLDVQHLILFVTSRCNAKCKMCFYWKSTENAKSMELSDIKKIAAKLDKMTYLSITGGEPFLRDDLPEICEAFKDKVQCIHIPTNGMLSEKIEATFRDALSRCPNVFFKISLSLDGTGKLHDEIRGVPGIFKNVLDTKERLFKLKKEFRNFEINVITTFSSFNQDKMREIQDFVATLGVDYHNMTYVRGNPRVPESKNASAELYQAALDRFDDMRGPSKEKFFLKVMHELKRTCREHVLFAIKNGKNAVPCVAGRKIIVINENCDVYPCEILGRSMGNVKDFDYDIKRLLKSEASKNVIDFIRKGGCSCTFECAIQNSIVSNPSTWPRLLINSMKK